MSSVVFPSFGREAKRGAISVWLPLVTAVAYYLGAQAAFLVGTLSDKIFAPLWPPNIVLLCALLLVPREQWWQILLAAVPAHVIAELGVGMPLPQIIVAFVTNAIVALCNAIAIRAFIGNAPWFDTPRKTLLYMAITAVATPAIVAFGGAFIPIMGGGAFEDYWTHWAQWALANAVSSLALGPITLILLTEWRTIRLHARAYRWIEAGLLFSSLLVISSLTFSGIVGASLRGFLPTLLYMPLPLILWSAIRFGTLGASTSSIIVAVVLIWIALNDSPTPFAALTPDASVLAIQSFLISLIAPLLITGSAIDETRSTGRAARESEERMAFAAVAGNLAMWMFYPSTGRFWITDHGRTMFGFDSHENVTKDRVISALHPDDRERVLEILRTVAANDQLGEAEFRIVRPDGTLRWVRGRARSEHNDDDKGVRISGTCADITARKLAESEVARQRRDLAHLMRVSMLGELSGGIAHELTQPLAAILSNAEAARLLIAETSPDLDEIAAAIDDIIVADNRAGEVIHRLRGMLRRGDSKFELIDLNELLNSSLHLLNHEFISRHITVKNDLRQRLPRIVGDAIQLQQVLLNLMMNAVEATNDLSPSQRTIIIRTDLTPEDKILIEIEDNGVGIASLQRAQIFQPFFTTKERGLGLGLTICSSIVKAHGGTLDLQSNATGGATAAVILPGERIKVG